MHRIVTDNKAVYRAIGCMCAPKSNFGMLMRQAISIWTSLTETGWILTIDKVKSHCTQADVDAGVISLEDMKGNNLADHWAGSGAKLDGMDSDFIRSASIFDHQAFLIRNRLIASVQQGSCRATVINREPKVPERGFMPVLRALGHEPIRTGNQLECLACGQNWSSRQTREVVSRGL